jgi:hypothetical protein
MLARLIPVALPLLLGACDMKVGKDESRDNISTVLADGEGNVVVAAAEEPQGMSVSVPGFQAKVNIPGLELDSEHLDIDGLKLYPGTRVTTVNVNSKEGAGVMMHFTSPGTPAQLAQYYADSARQHNFTDVSVRSDTVRSTLAATKPDGDRLTIALAPAANGSSGQITVIDSK